jgi:hypothetical protein
MDHSDQTTSGQIFAKWKIPAYPHYERGTLWYIVTGLIGGIILVIAFLTYNFLLAVLVVMVGVVMVIQGGVRPPTVEVEISPLGIRRGSHFSPYASIDHFWIVYDPPIKSLHFVVPHSLFPVNHIPIDDQDPVELRTTLKKFIREDTDRDAEPVLDSISRILKI